MLSNHRITQLFTQNPILRSDSTAKPSGPLLLSNEVHSRTLPNKAFTGFVICHCLVQLICFDTFNNHCIFFDIFACYRLYQYIHGANLNSARFPVTAPVLTSINPTTANGSICYVKIYLTAKSPPQPNSELNLEIEKWTSHCIAVRMFSGFAKDDNINKEVEALMNSLNLHFTGNTSIPEDKLSYTIAQYNSSRHQAGRLNEVWMNVPGFNAEGCSNYRRNY